MKFRFPLTWPDGWPRTAAAARIHGSPFKVAPSRALADLEKTVHLISGSRDHLLSSNVHISSVGRPYAEELGRPLTDPGVAVYWTRKGQNQAVACDLYAHPGNNMRALGLALDGLRAMERSGIPSVVDRAFAGFARLPASTSRPWWAVLGYQADPIVPGSPSAVVLAGVEASYRSLSKSAHPDVPGGSAERMVELNAAVAEARKLLGDKP